MVDITITIDETLQAQTLYCPDIPGYLTIYLLKQNDINSQLADLATKVQKAQADYDALQAINKG